MKVLLDACVLYPTVMREMLVGAARAGLYTPLWSPRILEEWARAAAKLGAGGEEVARGEIAVLRANWPRAEVLPRGGDMARLYLPDENDIHVLASAIAGSADMIITENRADFPRGILLEEGLTRQSADPFLLGLFEKAPDKMIELAEEIRAEAEHLSGQSWPIRKLMKKARLPRLGKALELAS
ncbi:MAG: PIN domain-containing protein [Rhodobacteraceae bacterium]|nr:PIN domain-containing protein [Paracoccaceae bacterium]